MCLASRMRWCLIRCQKRIGTLFDDIPSCLVSACSSNVLLGGGSGFVAGVPSNSWMTNGFLQPPLNSMGEETGAIGARLAVLLLLSERIVPSNSGDRVKFLISITRQTMSDSQSRRMNILEIASVSFILAIAAFSSLLQDYQYQSQYLRLCQRAPHTLNTEIARNFEQAHASMIASTFRHSDPPGLYCGPFIL